MQDDDETDEHDVEREDEDMVDAGADLYVDEGTDDDNDSDGEGADEDVAEFAGLAVNMLTIYYILQISKTPNIDTYR